MQTVRLDISNDIFDKVMFILENLPKNKIYFQVEPKKSKHEFKKESIVSFFHNSPLKESIVLERETEFYNNRIEF